MRISDWFLLFGFRLLNLCLHKQSIHMKLFSKILSLVLETYLAFGAFIPVEKIFTVSISLSIV